MSDRSGQIARLWLMLAAALFASALLFAGFPGIDPAVSAYFYRPDSGFPIAANPEVEWIRQALWQLSNLTFVAALAGLIGTLVRRQPLLGQGLWSWSYVLLLFLIGPVLLVNRVLKEHWGRARPADTSLFGGGHDFTPFWEPAHQCLSNCSFVSGEVAGSTATAIAMLVMAPGLSVYLGKVGITVWRGFAMVLPFVVILQRVAAGRHFLSDAVFAALFTCAVALLLAPLLRRDARD